MAQWVFKWGYVPEKLPQRQTAADDRRGLQGATRVALVPLKPLASSEVFVKALKRRFNQKNDAAAQSFTADKRPCPMSTNQGDIRGKLGSNASSTGHPVGLHLYKALPRTAA